MKKQLLLFIALLLTVLSYGQLTGIKTIPGDYPTIAAAVADLNTVGIGAGGVIFNVTAGYTESITAPILLTATGSVGNPIIFQKSGAGANPIITRTDAGTNATSTLGGQGDAVWIIQGSDYLTIDGINISATDQGIEYGYYFRKASVTDGCKNSTLKNSVITMTKGTSAYVVGIYSSNNSAASLVSSATGITVTSTGGRNENINITGNTISNVFAGILFRGYNHSTSPYDFQDQNNVVGAVGAGNTIQNYAGNAASSSYGVYAIYQTSPVISYNTINNAGGGGTNATATLYGIFISSSNAGGDIVTNNNLITLNQGSTSAAHCINISPTGTSFTANNNQFSYGAFASTSTSYMIYCSNGTNNITLTGNQTTGTITKTGIGQLNGYYNYGSPTGGTTTISNNNFSNITLTGASMFYGIQHYTTTTQTMLLNNNTISNITGGSSPIYGIYQGYGASGCTVNGNTISNINSSGTIYGITLGASSDPISLTASNNTVTGLNTTGASTIYGIYNLLGTLNNIRGNNIYNLSATNAAGFVYGIYISGGTTTNVFNNFISDLRTPAANAAIPLAGIYASGGTTDNIFYNTVFLNGASTGALFGSTAVYASTTPTVDMRNNILVNLSTPNGATGFTSAYRRSTSTLTTFSNNSNYNDLYAGTPSASRLIYYDGTTGYQTINSYITAMAPRESASVTENPPFINSATTPYDLHLSTATATFIESGGTRITTPIAVTSDYDNNIRWGEAGYAGTGSAPDIGADEFNGIPLYTCTPPVPGNTVSTGNNLCLGQTITLSLQNAMTGTGNSYQWKSSPDNIVYTNIVGATSSSLTLTPTAQLYYECFITCLNGPVSATSTPLLITFSNTITSTTPATRCGTGTVNLLATASAGATIKWYAGSTGGVSLGSGSPFTTPTIPATTTYYVGAEMSASGNAMVGAGSTTSSLYPDPFYSLWSNTHNQYLITAAELAASGLSAGNITSLSLNITSGVMVMQDFSVKMGPTAATNMSAFLSPAFTIVYTAATQTPVIGLNTLTFSTPFVWDGSSNVVIEICHGNASSSATMNSTCTVDNTAYISTIHVHKSASSAGALTCADLATNLTTYSIRPNFTFAGTVSCSSPRIAVVATVTPAPLVTVVANPTTICGGQNSILTASSVNAGYTYSWAPVTTPAIGSTVTATPNATTTYTVTALDNSGGPDNGCRSEVTTLVTVLPTPSTVTITPLNPSINLGQIQSLTASGGTLPNQVLLHENFNTSAPTWVITNGPTSPLPASWHYENCPFTIASHAFTNFSTLDGGKFAMSNADEGGSGSTTVSMLTSPSFNTANYTDLSLTFEQLYFKYVDDIKAAVEISTDGGTVWTTLIDYLPLGSQGTTTSNAQATTTSTINLSAYLNQPNVKIRFHYESAWGYYWIVDNVTISGTSLQPMTWTPVTSLYTDAGATVPYIAGTPATNVFAQPASTITYTATATAPSLCTTSGISTVTVNPPTVGGTLTPAYISILLGFTPPTLMLSGYVGTVLRWQERVNGGAWTDIPGTAGISAYLSVPASVGVFEYQVEVQSGTFPSAFSTIAIINVFSAPTVTTDPASAIGLTSGTLNGTVNANNDLTSLSFEYGTTTLYGTTVPGIPVSANGITSITFNAPLIGLATNTTYHYRAIGTNAGGTINGLDMTFLTGCPQPAPAGLISGSMSACQNGTGYVYSVGTIVNAVSYAWTLPTGGSFVSGSGTNSITVAYNTTAVSGNVTVAGVGTCGSGTSSSLPVTVNPMPVPTINGPATSCAGSTTNVYVTEPGMTGYVWTVSTGGSITAGGTTNTITVTWATSGPKTVTANYANVNGCIAAVPASYAVTVNVAPTPTITGATSMCVNSGYFDYVTQPGFTGYVWTISSGGVINYGSGTDQIQVSWVGSGPQWVAVNYNNASGCAATIPVQLPVSVTPPPSAASTISGTATVCGGTNGVAYSTAAINGALTYVWSLPAGATIATGAGTNSITVNFAGTASSGNITVYGNNLCGNGTLSPAFPVTVNPLPVAAGTITGTASVCNGATGVVYTIPTIVNATTYNWTVPAGVTITSGANTATITVDFTASAVSGIITVAGNNACGNGPASPDFAVTVNPIPATPVITDLGADLTSSAALGNQWYFSATQGGTGAAISGATGQTYTATLTGYYWDMVTLVGCSSDTSNHLYIVIEGISNPLTASAFTVYPVPSDGKFTVSFSGKANQLYSINVYNSLGSSIFEQKNIQGSGNTEQTIDLRPVAPGIYTVIFSDGANRLVKKMVVR